MYSFPIRQYIAGEELIFATWRKQVGQNYLAHTIHAECINLCTASLLQSDTVMRNYFSYSVSSGISGVAALLLDPSQHSLILSKM